MIDPRVVMILVTGWEITCYSNALLSSRVEVYVDILCRDVIVCFRTYVFPTCFVDVS